MATDANGKEIVPAEFTVDELRILLYRTRELARRCRSDEEEELLVELQVAVMRYARWIEKETRTRGGR